MPKAKKKKVPNGQIVYSILMNKKLRSKVNSRAKRKKITAAQFVREAIERAAA